MNEELEQVTKENQGLKMQIQNLIARLDRINKAPAFNWTLLADGAEIVLQAYSKDKYVIKFEDVTRDENGDVSFTKDQLLSLANFLMVKGDLL